MNEQEKQKLEIDKFQMQLELQGIRQ